ncbi:MAG: alpha/beta hydrolase [Chthoniobacterales bacterium]
MSQLDFIHRFDEGAHETGVLRVLLLLPGTGGDENDLLPLGRALDPAAALLSVRGKVLENGNPRFFRRLAEGVFDEEDVVRRAKELAEFVKAAALEYGFSDGSVTAVGYSNGANIAGAMLLLGVATFSSAILFRAMVPLVPERLPKLSGRALFISEGERDPIVSRDQAQTLTTLLRDAGAAVTLNFQGAGHELIQSDLQSAREWLARLGEHVR